MIKENKLIGTGEYMPEGYNPLKVKFLGAAQEVTGSKTLISYMDNRYLVDCGLFQGDKELRKLNWEPLKQAQTIDGVLLTHAHLDHSGYLPILYKQGFRGKIYCTEATATLLKILLTDAAKLAVEDAEFANKTGHSHYRPALPLFTIEDVEGVLKLLQRVRRDEWIELARGLSVQFIRSGHLLGSSLVQLNFWNGHENKLITFTGDLGSDRSQVLKGPVYIKSSDYLVIEGTYGDKVHRHENLEHRFAKIINRVHSRHGVLVIPSFAVGRAQEVLFIINKLEREQKIPKMPVYIDSPMALDATEIYSNYRDELKPMQHGDEFISSMDARRFTPINTVQQSMALNRMPGPAIIISASGMLTGGRILHHLKARLPDRRNAVLFIGFQAEGTKGRLLQNGIDRIRLHHEEIEVEAEIYSLEGMSAHADIREMVDWLKHFSTPPGQVFLNHGENIPLRSMAYRLKTELGLNVVIPHRGDEFDLF
jgi:metallo-beta-lactamase family protein